MIQSDVPVVFLDSGLNGTLCLSTVDLTTFAEDAGGCIPRDAFTGDKTAGA